MSIKKTNGSKKAGEEKRKVKRKTIEFREELIVKYESGMHCLCWLRSLAWQN